MIAHESKINRLESCTREEELRALEQRYVTAARAKDLQGVMSCYVADDSLLVFDVNPPRQFNGAKAYAAAWAAFIGQFDGGITFDAIDLAIAAGVDIGFGTLVYRVTGTRHGGTSMDLVVRVTHGYRKLDGQWLIVHEHVSVPVDPTTGVADFVSEP